MINSVGENILTVTLMLTIKPKHMNILNGLEYKFYFICFKISLECASLLLQNGRYTL